MAKIFLLCWGCFYFLGSHAQAEKIDTDRPDQTESAVLVPKNYFQAEFGFNKENLYFSNYDLIHPAMLLKYGLNRFEFRLEATYKSSYEQRIPEPVWTTGFDPLVIGFKAALMEEKKLRPKTSLIVHLGLPKIASRAFRARRLAPAFRFTMQHSLTEQAGLSYNLGAEWDGFTTSPIWLYTLAPGLNIGDKWYTYIEIFGFFPRNEPAQHNLDAGIAYYISRDIKIDMSGGLGITDSAPENYVALGFSFRFNTRKTKK
jgi:hypothetical protein